MEITAIIYILLLVIFGLVGFSVMQLRLAGIKVKDFWSFIQANQMLDKLYVFSKKCNSMSPQEQVIFLSEAEKVFNAIEIGDPVIVYYSLDDVTGPQPTQQTGL